MKLSEIHNKGIWGEKFIRDIHTHETRNTWIQNNIRLGLKKSARLSIKIMICNILKYIWFTPIIVTQKSYQYSSIHQYRWKPCLQFEQKIHHSDEKKTQVTFSSANMKWYTNTWIAQVMFNTLGYKHLLRGTKWGGGGRENLLPTAKIGKELIL